jgi:LCP family protein required for cell wall assembly
MTNNIPYKPQPLPAPPTRKSTAMPKSKHVMISQPRVLLLSYLINVFIPGSAFFRSERKRTKTVGVLFLLVWLSLIGIGAYLYFSNTLMDVGLTVISDGTHLQYASYAIYAVSIIAVTGILSGTCYINHKALLWNKIAKGLLLFVSFVITFALIAGNLWVGSTIQDVKQTLEVVAQEKNAIAPKPVQQPKIIKADTPVWGDETRINMMILGSDQGADRIGIRPDILMVASINTKTGETQLFNLPRNLTGARFPAGTPAAKVFPRGFTAEEGLINAVWTWAETRPELFPDVSNPGLEATRQIMGETLGLNISYYMVVNMQGFTDLVDTVGGVTVNVPRDLPKAKTGTINPPLIKAGQNKLLNGDDALWFVRSRADSTDYDRILRQRCMISALTNELDGQTIVTSLPQLLLNLRENFSTNINQADVKDWSGLFDKVRDNTIQGYAFTNDVINPAKPNFPMIKKLVAESTFDEEPLTVQTKGEFGSLAKPTDVAPAPAAPEEVEQPNPYC